MCEVKWITVWIEKSEIKTYKFEFLDDLLLDIMRSLDIGLIQAKIGIKGDKKDAWSKILKKKQIGSLKDT